VRNSRSQNDFDIIEKIDDEMKKQFFEMSRKRKTRAKPRKSKRTFVDVEAEGSSDSEIEVLLHKSAVEPHPIKSTEDLDSEFAAVLLQQIKSWAQHWVGQTATVEDKNEQSVVWASLHREAKRMYESLISHDVDPFVIGEHLSCVYATAEILPTLSNVLTWEFCSAERPPDMSSKEQEMWVNLSKWRNTTIRKYNADDFGKQDWADMHSIGKATYKGIVEKGVDPSVYVGDYFYISAATKDNIH